MCLLGLLLQPGARVPLLLAHNRDEFFDRPAGAPDIAAAVLCGRDERGGGTWAGLNRASGVAVALTNAGRRARSPPGFLSRGTLVADVLCGRAAAAALSPAGLRAACARAGAGEAVRVALPGAVAGFNLIVVDTHELAAWYITNKPQKEALAHLPAADRAELLCGVDDHGLCELPPTAAVASRIAPGAHALSNSTLDDERWEKVAWLRAKLAALTSAPGTLVAADTAAAEGGGGGDDEDMRTLRALLEEVVPIFTHTGGLASEARMPDLSWSCLEPAQERHLQDHAFILPAHGVRYGTREIAFTVCVRQATFFVYRAFAPDATDAGSSSSHAPRAPDLICADAHPGAGAGETVLIDGQEWLIVRG